MAVNYADGFLFASLFVYPIAGAKGALDAGAGWLAIAFIPAGFAFGLAVIYVGRRIVYGFTGWGMAKAEKTKPAWLQQVFFVPFVVAYLSLPVLAICLGAAGSWFAAKLVVTQYLS